MPWFSEPLKKELRLSLIHSKGFAMAGKFKIDDIVQLKSGGPKSTIAKALDGFVHSVWFAGSKKETGMFPFEAALVHQEEKKS